MATALDNDRRSPRKLLRAVVARLLGPKAPGLSGLLLEKKSAGAKRPPAPQPADSLPVFRNPHLLLEIEADKPRALQFSLTSWG